MKKKEFWQEKKVLLTGHTGFKGTWMSVMLKELGAVVCGYSLPVSEYSFYRKVSPQVDLHEEGDIADEKKVFSVVDSFQPDIILHFASHSSLDGSMKIPHFILRTNLMGVVNVLEAARRKGGVRAIIIVTSDKCYLDMETEKPYTENSLLGAKDPYSTSKVCQELLTGCYMETFFQENSAVPGIATARASNVIGAGDYNVTRLMPYLLDCFCAGRTAKIRNPHAVRPWQYVLDVLYGYLLLAEKLYYASGVTTDYNGAYNFGPEEDGFAQVGQIVEMVSSGFGNALYEFEQGERAIRRETGILKLDSTKAHEVLGWKVFKSLEETVALTVDFVRGADGSEGRLCRVQVRDYLKGVEEDV